MSDLMGNVQLFRAVVKYGFFDIQSFADFMYAYTQMQGEARNSGDLHPTASEKESLRTHALMARANLREGRRLSKKSKPLSDEQQELLCKFESGELEREVLAANKNMAMDKELLE